MFSRWHSQAFTLKDLHVPIEAERWPQHTTSACADFGRNIPLIGDLQLYVQQKYISVWIPHLIEPAW